MLTETTSTSHSLPHSKESERAVLGGVLLDPRVFPSLLRRLVAEDFFTTRNRLIFEAMLEVQSNENTIDMRTLQAQLEQRKHFDRIGGIAYLASLDLVLPDLGRLDSYIGIVKERSVRRRLIAACGDVARNCLDGGLTADEALTDAANRVETLKADTQAPDRRRVWTLRELVNDPERLKPPEAVLARLAWKGRLGVLYGPPKDGKTTLASKGAAAVSQGDDFLGAPTPRGVVLWATEEDVDDAAGRLVDDGADLDRVVVMEFGPDPPGALREEVERLRPDLVVVDTLTGYAEQAAPDSGSASAWAAIMRPLARHAHKYDCATWVQHHSRRSDGEFRDSSEIAAAVDVMQKMSGSGTTRQIDYKGRRGIGIGKFSVRLVNNRFELVNSEKGSLDLSGSLVEFIRAHKDCSQNEVRGGVVGSTDDKRDALANLERDGSIINVGGKSRHRYRVNEAALHSAEKPPQDRPTDRSDDQAVRAVRSSRSKRVQEGGPVGGPSGPPVPNPEVRTGTAGPPVPTEGIDI